MKEVTGVAHARAGTGNWSATGVSIDSRTVQPGDLFIAIAGDNSDGHAYVADAVKKGAVAAIVSRPVDGVDAEKLLIVDDTFKALQELGQASRARTAASIIAVTGSVGKTGTKEMLAVAFATLGQTHASIKSYNNHWGVPYSLSTMHAGTDYGIFEVGMNHAGEIAPLSEMIQPDVSIITTVEAVHAGNFPNGEEGIADAKAEIFDGMKEGGTVILNADNQWFDHLCKKASAKNLKIISFGENEKADVRLAGFLVAANGSRIEADVMGERVSFTMQSIGKHLALNALSALAAIKAVDGDVKKAARAIGKIEPLAGRGKRELLDLGDAENPVVLIDESYNASPVAMKAAFKVLAMIDPGRGGRRIAVLGDMYELGADGPRLHKELALPLEMAGVQLVYTSGPLMKNLYDSLPQDKRGAHVDDTKELAKIVPEVLVPGDVVMVKGSRGPGEKPRMQLVVEALRALPDKLKKKGLAR
ncbi:MAG: UDP-N-acetylmuramoylalanyl-D-glutamyl-2, 6-diaminopimelate--D-alanyl-D-alanine ligase [Micavibrio aeruginosavorus]|uniref:UDP-N-acetylmuramoyl-tripeptide--D-alanyl-D-alanine ligase n=1 Tax=Micavibrio aeruginosavorus TaxID=349221 RepID=A0A2W5MUF7_9BACT|nr:MAG: UDP-N-acetylmuramoylalanyl-D-glutamyl-2, 6-diaminopimelate--D-alanyl-D-alanine ligase [Micavibrio aeruginosavorus]